jgi:hypothetical protein
MSLTDWLNQGLLRKHTSSPEEIAELLHLVDRDLQQCKVEGLAEDWRLVIAYNAAMQCANAALAAAGYKTVHGAHHYRVIQSLAFTLGWEATETSKLDSFRKKRHVAGYERAGAVSRSESMEILRIAIKLRADLGRWLKVNHPELLEQTI